MTSNVLRKAMVPVLGLVVVLVLLLASPRAVHAVVATLVQVANTTANPVNNLDTERNARIPYQNRQFFFTTGAGNASVDFTTVPNGYRLVAQNVSAYLILTSGATAPFGILENTGLPGAVGPSNGSTRPGGFSTQITAYFNAGDTPRISIVADFDNGGGAGQQIQWVTLAGYLENCSITGCPTIY